MRLLPRRLPSTLSSGSVLPGYQMEESMSVLRNVGLVMPAIGALALLAAGTGGAWAQQANLSFFVTSVGLGKGGDLGGLAGADAHCQGQAQAAGAGGKTWRAYLSTQTAGGATAVKARDRIGAGPWSNAKGV